MGSWGNGSNITQYLVNEIGSAIVQGEYLVGQNLPTEAELAENFEVSRSVMREAMKILSAKGLVRSWPRRGTVVQEENNWNLLDAQVLDWILGRNFALPLLVDFLEMRLAIEPVAAMMVARDGNDIDLIKNAMDAMRLAETGVGDSLRADRDFHTSILIASGNRFFLQMMPLVDTALKMSIKLTNKMKGVAAANIDEHENVYQAIRDGDPKKAQIASETLIKEALALVVEDINIEP